MDRSLWAVIGGTFTLRFSTGLTGAMLAVYLAKLPEHGGQPVDAFVVGVFAATFYLAELVLSPFFGALSDRIGHHKVMLFGPVFGAVAVILTAITTNLLLLGGTRWLGPRFRAWSRRSSSPCDRAPRAAPARALARRHWPRSA